MKEDKVNHPSHYTWLKNLCGIEVIDITRHMNFNLGNVVKYILRAGHKSEEGYSNSEKELEDLNKAQWYLNDEIKTRGGEIPINKYEQQIAELQKEIKDLKSHPTFKLTKNEIFKIAEILQKDDFKHSDNLVTIQQHHDSGIGVGTDLLLTVNDGKIGFKEKIDITDYSAW